MDNGVSTFFLSLKFLKIKIEYKLPYFDLRGQHNNTVRSRKEFSAELSSIGTNRAYQINIWNAKWEIKNIKFIGELQINDVWNWIKDGEFSEVNIDAIDVLETGTDTRHSF